MAFGGGEFGAHLDFPFPAPFPLNPLSEVTLDFGWLSESTQEEEPDLPKEEAEPTDRLLDVGKSRELAAGDAFGWAIRH